MPDALDILRKLSAHFDRLGIPFYVGGSLASSLHGEYRSTQDVDLVADIALAQVDALTAALQGEFYADRDVIHSAVARRDAFNVLDLTVFYKADIFVLSEDEFAHSQMSRRQFLTVPDPAGPFSVPVATAEDIILQKFRWFVLGGRVSERQLSDIRGVLKTRRGELDIAYLRHWADILSVSDLLERAMQDAYGAWAS